MVIFIRIGLIDSGLGAISVLNHLLKQKKHHEYILFLDYKYNPFGQKKDLELYNRLLVALNYLKQRKCQKIVIACNTLAIIALKYHIENVITPIIYFKEILKKYFNDNSILLATNLTIDSKIYPYNSIKASDLVLAIEGHKPFNLKYFNLAYDNIFLGCTHFNLISNKFKNKTIYDSGLILANNINFENSSLSIEINLTKCNQNILNHLKYHLHTHFYQIKVLNI